ncbi:MAG: ornithine cyclodeaminase [Verrucomicrobia bacterium]|nr:ornithine cyclodeaminase [Verrucomicrobiota bacterium]
MSVDNGSPGQHPARCRTLDGGGPKLSKMTNDNRKLRFLSAADVRRALPMPEAITVMKAAFRELSENRAVVPLRTHVPMPEHRGDVLVMPAYSPGTARFGLKVITLFENNPALKLPFIQAMVMVFDTATGSPVAIMEGTSLTAIRSGAASGAATDFLACKDARKVAIFGAGIQARTQLEAVCAVRTIREASVFDHDRARAAAFAREATAAFGITVSVAPSSAAALDGAAVVCTATTSATPVFADHEVAPGTHINAIGSYKPHMREIPPETVVRALVVVDQHAAAWEEAGDLILPLHAGLIQADHVHAELGEIAAGSKPGRTHRDTVTFFKSVGIAIQDLAAASCVLANARTLGLGTEVPL